MRPSFFNSTRLACVGACLTIAMVLQFSLSSRAADESPQQRRGGRGGGPERGVYKARLSPNWFNDSTQFWYRNDLRGGAKEFIVVDTKTGTRQPAFDHAKLAAALSKAAGEE